MYKKLLNNTTAFELMGNTKIKTKNNYKNEFILNFINHSDNNNIIKDILLYDHNIS